MTPERLLTAQETAARLGVCRSFLTRHAAEIGGRKVGTRLKFAEADIAAYLESRRVVEKAEQQPAPPPARRLSVVGRGDTNPVTGQKWSTRANRPEPTTGRREIGGRR